MLDFNVRTNWQPPQWPLWTIIVVVLLAAILAIKDAIF